jgi:short-subunit dehydrogenase
MGRYDLTGKYVLITGASSGIGKELSRCFAQESAHCLLGALPAEAESLVEWAEELRRTYGVDTWTIPVDLSKEDGPEQVFRSACVFAPQVDVLVNNAGLLTYGPFHETELARYDKLLLVNIRAYVALMRLCLPGMISRREGRILNVSSASAFQPTAWHAVYAASKAFVQSLSEAVRAEVRGSGVKICTLSPSYTDTPMLKGDDMPEKLLWYWVSGLSDPTVVARKAVKAVKKGKALCMPGWRNRLLHLYLPRVSPRWLATSISVHGLRRAGR